MKLSFSLLSALLLISCVALSNGSSIQISREEINTSALIQDIIDHGVDYCFQKAADKYGISDSNIEVTRINSVYKLESRQSTIYTCDVEATNNDGENLMARFEIEFDLETEEQIVRKWGYNLFFDGANSQHNQEHDVETEVDTEDIEAGSSDGNTDVSNEHSETETEIVQEEEEIEETPEEEEEIKVISPVETETELEIQIESSTENAHQEADVEAEVEVEVEAAVTVEEEQTNTDVAPEVTEQETADEVDTADSEQETEFEIAGVEVEAQIHVTKTSVGADGGVIEEAETEVFDIEVENNIGQDE